MRRGDPCVQKKEPDCCRRCGVRCGFDVITKAGKVVEHFADIESARKYARDRKMTVRYWAVGAEEKGE